MNVNVGLPPDAVYNIVIDPDNKKVFKNIKVSYITSFAFTFLHQKLSLKKPKRRCCSLLNNCSLIFYAYNLKQSLKKKKNKN